MTTTTTTPSLNATTGILTIREAATILGVPPIRVQRLIALGKLPDNRNSKGSVVFKADLERFIGQGLPRLEMPKLNASGWYEGAENFVKRTEFLRMMKKNSEGLLEVTDKQIDAAFKRRRTLNVLRFNAPPTPAMKQAYREDAAMFLADEKGYSFGVSALAASIRGAVWSKIQARRQGGEQLKASLEVLFESPKRYKSLVAAATRNLSALDIVFRDVRTIPSTGTQRAVERIVSGESLSDNWQRDINRAVELAF